MSRGAVTGVSGGNAGDIAERNVQAAEANANANTANANPYANGIADWMKSDINMGKEFLVDPSSLSQLNLTGQSFDPYRQQALADINAATSSGLAGAQTSLAQTGGLGAADRMALASRFNRDKIMGRQQALGKYAGMEAQSAADADKANQMFNVNQMNQNLYANRDAQEQAFQRQIAESQLQRQLKASGMTADATANAASGGGGILSSVLSGFGL